MLFDRRRLLASVSLVIAGISVMAAADPDDRMHTAEGEEPVKAGVIYADRKSVV